MRYIVRSVRVPRYETGRQSADFGGRIVAVFSEHHDASETKMDVLIELHDTQA